MWSTCLSFLLAALTASTLAAPSPLTTSASTVTTLSDLQSAQDGILIHVLRTEDLIADKLKSQPLLLERLSHLLIRVEIGNQTVAVNDHSLPLLPGERPLEINVQLNQVQMLKMPENSPLIPLGLTPPELLNIADKYMSEGIVAAMLSVTQEPLLVEAKREDNTPVQAEAYKVTIGIKILEVDGLSLAETDIPAVDLLHLIVHPDSNDPTKVATVTTLAPEALVEPSASMFGPGFDNTRSSIESTFDSLINAVQGMAAQAAGLMRGSHHRKPCHKHHHHQAAAAAASEKKPVELAAATEAPSSSTPQQPAGRHSLVSSFRHKMACFARMVTRSSMAILLLGLPLALVFMMFASVVSSLVKRRLASSAARAPPSYEAVLVDEKLSDDEVVVLMTAADGDKA